MRRHQEHDAVESCPVGRDPRKMTVEELNALGHQARPLLEVIRENCIDCAGGSQAEVRRCAQVSCPMWPYRMNSNPLRKREMSDEQRAQASERLARAREARA